jgi:uncharacterized phage-associated protein
MFGNDPSSRLTPETTGDGYGDGMGTRAVDVAQELRRRLPGVPTKKLHKLLYYCQGHHLGVLGRPLFSDSVQAWDMGPVVAVLWHQEREGPMPPDPGPLSEQELNTVGYVVSRYGRLSGTDLEHLTHAEDPWRRADQDRRRGESVRIELEWMREYSSAELEDETQASDLPERSLLTTWLVGASQRRTDELTPDSDVSLRGRMEEGSRTVRCDGIATLSLPA